MPVFPVSQDGGKRPLDRQWVSHSYFRNKAACEAKLVELRAANAAHDAESEAKRKAQYNADTAACPEDREGKSNLQADC
jgi:hypothetical protein